VAAALIIAAGVGGWMLSNRGGAAGSTAPRDPITVLVAEFQNNTGDPVFSGVLEQAFSLGIEGASFITAYPQAFALRSAAAIKPGSRLDEPTARLVATRDGIKLVLLGSVASGKYVQVLQPIFGDRLMFPPAFVGRGDMSRGGLMLRCAASGEELDYIPVEGAIRQGKRPPRLDPATRVPKIS